MATNIGNTAKQKQLGKIDAFRRLHVPGEPVILYNIWDAGSAEAVARSGAKAIATSSWAVAKAHGFADGEEFPYDLAVVNLRQIVDAVDLPVTFDLESGYGERPEEIVKNASSAVAAGAVGCNFEDSVPGSGAVRDTATQASRIQGVRQAADAFDVPFFINARCDLFFQGPAVNHDEVLLAAVVERSIAYAEAGADGLFVPGLSTISLIARLAKESPIPLNILVESSASLQLMADSGVARISFGAAPYVTAMSALEKTFSAIGR